LDRRLRIQRTATILRQRGVEKTMVVTGAAAPANKIKEIQRTGAQVLRLPGRGRWIPFTSLLKRLGRMGMLSVMIEGGATTAARALTEGVVDKIVFFYAPKVIGGEGRSMVDVLGIKRMNRCKTISDMDVKRFGEDLMVTGYLKS